MGMTCLRTVAAIVSTAGLVATASGATKGLVLTVDPACGNPFVNAYGPYDYRTNQGPQLKIVEDYHFTPEVEGLIRGVSGALAGEIDYTLRAFPNHHRALAAMMNLSAKMKSNTLKGANWPVECYFTRALAFRNDDQIARMLYAKYLSMWNRPADAVRQLDAIAEAAQDNPFTHHNLGLLYVEVKEYDKALAQAHRAMELGFVRPDLKDRLVAAGKWADPAPAAPAAPAAAASAASAASN